MSPRRKGGPRGPKKRWLVLAIFAVITIAAVALVLSRSTSHPTEAAVAADSGPVVIPTTFASLGAASGPAKPAAQPGGTGGSGGLAGMPMANGQFNQPGLVGNGWSRSQTAHTVVLHAWSSSPIPAMGWWVPTAHAGGKLFAKTSEWTHTFTAYGNPKYAELYLATDYRGIRVDCTVSIDGVVKSSGHSRGPYGSVMCMA